MSLVHFWGDLATSKWPGPHSVGELWVGGGGVRGGGEEGKY